MKLLINIATKNTKMHKNAQKLRLRFYQVSTGGIRGAARQWFCLYETPMPGRLTITGDDYG